MDFYVDIGVILLRKVRNWFISVWLLLRTSFLSRGSSVPRVWML